MTRVLCETCIYQGWVQHTLHWRVSTPHIRGQTRNVNLSALENMGVGGVMKRKVAECYGSEWLLGVKCPHTTPYPMVVH